jgi:predicted membrane chloride channel (bestrophin family)
VAKLYSAFGGVRLLEKPDPLLWFLTVREVIIIAAVLEFAVVYVLLWNKSIILGLASVAWLSALFLLYRGGLSMIGYQGPCPCLGNVTDILHLDPEFANTVLKLMLAYLTIPSYALLIYLGFIKQATFKRHTRGTQVRDLRF